MLTNLIIFIFLFGLLIPVTIMAIIVAWREVYYFFQDTFGGGE